MKRSRLCFGLPGSRCCPVLASSGLISASSSLSGSRRCLRTHADSPSASVDPGSSSFGHACVFGPESNSCKLSSSQLGCRPRLQQASELPFSGSHLLSPDGRLPPGSVPRLSSARSHERFRLCPEQPLVPCARAQLPPGLPLGSSCRLQRVADSSEFSRLPFSSPTDARAPPQPPSPFAQLPSASEGLRLQIPSPSSPPHATGPRLRDPIAAPKLLSEAPRLRLPCEEAPGVPVPPPYRLLPLGSTPGLPATLCQLLLSASGSPAPLPQT